MKVPYTNETIEVPARDFFAVPPVRRTSAWLKDGTPILDITIATRRDNHSKDFDINIHSDYPEMKARINEFDYIVVCAENGVMYRLNDVEVESKRYAQLHPSQEWMGTAYTSSIWDEMPSLKNNRKQAILDIIDFMSIDEDK